jgi:hypothetical protein
MPAIHTKLQMGGLRAILFDEESIRVEIDRTIPGI